MSLQIYALKKNFAVQKAERFFKERRVQAQFVDLKKHKLGLRELQLFARAAGGARNLVDRENVNAMSHPVAHTDNEAVILEYLMEKPEFLRTPIVRDGQRVAIGEDPALWQRLAESQK
ncbi:MAG: ArsC family transcriptional regulator [Clostridia bacterium]|nr:ArsC family transcriptional regulator [Clostridia bacterium]